MAENISNELTSVYKIANSILNAGLSKHFSNPVYILSRCIQALYRYNGDAANITKIIDSLNALPLSRHGNLMLSFVKQWSEATDNKPLTANDLTDDQKEEVKQLNGCLAFVQYDIKEGYRTPLTLIDQVFVEYNQFEDQKKKQALKGISSKGQSLLAAYWLEQVAGWQH